MSRADSTVEDPESTVEDEGGGPTGDRDDPDGDRSGRPCPRCDRPMTHRHCKYVCPQHGVVYDCADTFY